VLPWFVWQRYGDTRIIDENWDAMMRFNSRIEALNPDGIWRNSRGMDYGDWLSVDAKSRADVTTPKELLSTAFWARSTRMLAEMAESSGRRTDAAVLRRRHERISAAFRTAFIRPDGGIGNDSQTSHILALHFGLVPTELRVASAARLAADIRRRNVRLSTGFMGTPYILDALADNGEEDLAIELLLQTESPSWGAMVMGQGTTMWERWDGIRNGEVTGSLNHYAFGAVVGFIYRRIAGINAAEPGFRRIRLSPLFSSRIGSAAAIYHSETGRILSKWARDGDEVTYEFRIPPNTTAELQLPAGHVHSVEANGIPVRQLADRPVAVPSGHYLIEMSVR